MTKGDDLWGDKPALGPGSKFGGVSAGPPADPPAADDVPTRTDIPAPTPDDVHAPTETRLEIEADRIDGLSKIDLAKKQAFELTAIRLLLERLSDQMDEIRGTKRPEPTDPKSEALP